MRLNDEQIKAIQNTVHDVVGNHASIRVFGSRADDAARSGDLDITVAVPSAVDKPAELSAMIGARVSRSMGGRQVGVVIDAPNLMRQSRYTTPRFVTVS